MGRQRGWRGSDSGACGVVGVRAMAVPVDRRGRPPHLRARSTASHSHPLGSRPEREREQVNERETTRERCRGEATSKEEWEREKERGKKREREGEKGRERVEERREGERKRGGRGNEQE